ncbi:MAG: hypothetical protein AB1Z63_07280 [Candidatus Limnocylindrales bacterium]
MTTAIDRAGSRLEERGRPNLDPDEQRTGGAALPAAVAAGRTAERDETTTGEASVGENLPPIPRAARPAVAAGRKRLRSLELAAPTVGALAAAISVAIIVTAVFVLVARSRRRSPAEEVMARLARVPERMPTARA